MPDTELRAAPTGALLARMAGLGRATLGLVLDTALPPLCASCRAPLADAGGLCPVCWSRVFFIAPPYCDRLGIPFAYDPELMKASRLLFTQGESVGPTQTLLWAARTSFLQQHRAAMVDFMEDVLRARRFYFDPKNHKEAVEIVSKLLSKLM